VRRRGLQTVQEKADLQSHGPGFGNKFGNKHDKKSSLQINSTAGKPLKTEPFSYLNRNRQVIGSSPIVGSILFRINTHSSRQSRVGNIRGAATALAY